MRSLTYGLGSANMNRNQLASSIDAPILRDAGVAVTSRSRSTAGIVAGVGYIAASVGFLVVFSWLAARFGYPDVLDQPAAVVLPRLVALGTAGRVVWMVYAVLPLLLIPASIAAASVLSDDDSAAHAKLRLATTLSIIAALAMTLGLARWSTAQWTLGEAWVSAGVAQRASITQVFDVLNVYLGNAIGEFLGELALYGSFLTFASVLWRRGSRWIASFGAVTGILGWIAMFRNVTPLVQPASEVANIALPLFLIAFGVMLARLRRD